MLFFTKTEQLDAHERRLTQIKRLPDFVFRNTPQRGPAFISSKMREINYVERKRLCVSNHLHRVSVDLDKTRAQAFVASDYLSESPLQRADVQLSFQQEVMSQVVERTIRLELVQEPESMLCKRERQVSLARRRLDRWICRAVLCLDTICNRLCESGDRRLFKDSSERHF